MYERSSFNLIVGGILALTVLALLGNIVLLATTGKAANELWTLASTLTGGLVGLLANPPRNDPPGGTATQNRAKRHITEGDKPE